MCVTPIRRMNADRRLRPKQKIKSPSRPRQRRRSALPGRPAPGRTLVEHAGMRLLRSRQCGPAPLRRAGGNTTCRNVPPFNTVRAAHPYGRCRSNRAMPLGGQCRSEINTPTLAAEAKIISPSRPRQRWRSAFPGRPAPGRALVEHAGMRLLRSRQSGPPPLRKAGGNSI